MSEEKKNDIITEMMTYHGKPIEKMNWTECKLEHEVQKWFANRCKRFAVYAEYGVDKFRRQLEEQSTRIEDTIAAEARGEATHGQVLGAYSAIKKKQLALERHTAEAEFLRMHMHQAYAIAAACKERQKAVNPPKKRAKPRKPYNWHTRVMAKKGRHAQPASKRRNPAASHHQRYARWLQSIERRELGALWDRDKFLTICADRGLGSMISVIYEVSQLLVLEQRQVKVLLDRGSFTWGQVLTLGAGLEMTPKEFCDTFLSGYFVELGEGEYRASLKNLPEDMQGVFTFSDEDVGTEQE